MDIITEKIKNSKFSSIKLRLGAIYLTIMLVILIIMSIFIVSTINNNLTENAKVNAFKKANVISQLVTDYEQPEEYEQFVLQNIGGTSMKCLITDSAGNVVLDTQNIDTGKTLTSSLITGAFLGNEQFDITKTENGKVLSVVVPIFNDSSVVGTVILNTPIDYISSALTTARTGLIIFGLILLIIVGILSFRMSFAIAIPMNDYVDIAKEISKGNFDKRIPVTGNSETDQLAEAMNYMCAELEHLEVKRRKFVSDASHELKTPMATIKLICDSITATENPDIAMVKEFLSDLSEEVDRLTRIIEKLLLLTKMDSEKMQISPELVDFGMMLQKIKNKLTPIAASKNITLCLDTQDDIPPLMLDYDRIWESVYNITDNAVKYSKIGSIVKLTLTSDENNIYFKVIDSGKGIPDEFKERIFERFYRLDDSRARETGGTGLGLSIAREAVQLHGGTLYVEDNPDGGSIFVIKLPFKSES